MKQFMLLLFNMTNLQPLELQKEEAIKKVTQKKLYPKVIKFFQTQNLKYFTSEQKLDVW